MGCLGFFFLEAKAQQNALLKRLLATPKHGQDPATIAAARQILDVSIKKKQKKKCIKKKVRE